MDLRAVPNSLYRDFVKALEQEDKPRCVHLAMEALERGSIDLVGLYTGILAPALNEMTIPQEERHLAIWKEHIRSAIVRTILECSYPYVLKELERKGTRLDRGTVVIVSPTDEYHEIGARMGSDFFNLCGYETVFVGSNTPKEDLVEGVQAVRPVYVVISATNTYSLVNVKKVVQLLKQAVPDVRILASGHAFFADPSRVGDVGAIGLLRTIEDIQALGGDR